MNAQSSSGRSQRGETVIRESSLSPESKIYGGYWLVELITPQPHTYVVRDVTMWCEPLPSGGEPEEWEWRLMAMTPGKSHEVVCGLGESDSELEPSLVFEPDSEGRASAVVIDSWGEEMLRLTSLGHNLFKALVGHELDVSVDDQDRAASHLNAFLKDQALVHPDEIEFVLEGTLGAFSDTVWAGRLEMSAKGYIANLLDLDGVRLEGATYNHPSTSGDRWLNMIEFEGFREEAPLDSSRPRALNLRSLPAFAALVNTPITISTRILDILISPERDRLYSPKEVPREIFIAALMVYALEEYGDDWEQGRSSPEALSLAEWILGVESGRRSVDLLDAMEIVCTPIAGWTRALKASALNLARKAKDIDLREDEEEFSSLSSELESTELDVLWAIHRDKLGDEIAPILEREGASADFTVRDDRSKLKLVFELHNDVVPKITLTPSISPTRRIFSDDQHREEYWLDWRSHSYLANSSELELDHQVVQWDVVVAGIITFTARQSGLFDPARLSIQVSARGVSDDEDLDFD